MPQLHRDRQRRAFGDVLFAMAACACVTLVVPACEPRERAPRLTSAEWPALERQGDSLRAAIERFRARHGAYPASLAEAGLDSAAVATRFGPWSYQARDARAPEACGAAAYALAVGDYDRNHFTLHWDCRRRAWSRNQ